MAHLFCLWCGSKLFCQPFVLWPGMNLSQLLGGSCQWLLAWGLGKSEMFEKLTQIIIIIIILYTVSLFLKDSDSTHWSLRRLFEAIQGAQYSLASLILRVSFHDCVPICENPWQNLPNVGAESLNKNISRTFSQMCPQRLEGLKQFFLGRLISDTII